MDVSVRTGSTKTPRDTSLVPLSFTSSSGEEVLFLMEILAHNREAKTVEKECETIMKHALLETEGDASERLDGTLKELNGLLKGLLVTQSVDDVHMIIAIVDTHRVLHVSHAGRAEAYLLRRGSVSQITEYSGRPTPAFVHISSGKLNAKDAVILSTQRLLRTFTPSALAQLGQQEDQVLNGVIRHLEAEGEHAAIGVVALPSGKESASEAPVSSFSARNDRQGRRRGAGKSSFSLESVMPYVTSFLDFSKSLTKTTAKSSGTWMKKGKSSVGSVSMPSMPSFGFMKTAQEAIATFMSDLRDPKRKRRAHFLLLASAVACLLIVWAGANLFTTTQRSKTKAELETLVEKVNQELQTAENRRLMGDIDKANEILLEAEKKAKQVMDNDAGLFRVEALDLLDRIRGKKEEINNIVRLSPRVVANLGAKNSDIAAEGIIGLSDGEFVVYDRQDLYRVILNTVEDGKRLSDSELILAATAFPRFGTLAFLTTGNSVVEVTDGDTTSMKTDDPKGWVKGSDMETYLRFLYVLGADNKQIYKYERLTGSYSAPVEYNVNGDLSGALDMAIDGNVYILKEGGTVLKLFRGESKPFVVRRAPDGVLKGTTKIFKTEEGNFYFLDPTESRIVILSDGGDTGEASYVKQYVLEGEQMGTLKDFYVDPDGSRLYVMDGKRVYVIDLTTR